MTQKVDVLFVTDMSGSMAHLAQAVRDGFNDYIKELRRRYAKVSIRKPAASRKRSPEVYALAQGKLAHPKQDNR